MHFKFILLSTDQLPFNTQKKGDIRHPFNNVDSSVCSHPSYLHQSSAAVMRGGGVQPTGNLQQGREGGERFVAQFYLVSSLLLLLLYGHHHPSHNLEVCTDPDQRETSYLSFIFVPPLNRSKKEGGRKRGGFNRGQGTRGRGCSHEKLNGWVRVDGWCFLY